jgi:hypothetical protein
MSPSIHKKGKKKPPNPFLCERHRVATSIWLDLCVSEHVLVTMRLKKLSKG